MKDPKNEFHLEALATDRWNLFAYHESPSFRHEKIVRQPGEPTASRWNYRTTDRKQPLQFKLRVTGEGGGITDPKFEVDRSASVTFAVELSPGQTLLCEGTATARVYDEKGRQIRTVQATGPIPVVMPGNHEVRFGCDFKGPGSPAAVADIQDAG